MFELRVFKFRADFGFATFWSKREFGAFVASPVALPERRSRHNARSFRSSTVNAKP